VARIVAVLPFARIISKGPLMISPGNWLAFAAVAFAILCARKLREIRQSPDAC